MSSAASPPPSKSLRQLGIRLGIDRCLACGACNAACPVSDWNQERLAPRRLLRLLQYGQEDQVVSPDWLWQCTTCGRCSLVCPSSIDHVALLSRARSLAPRDRDPGAAQIQKTAELHLESSNNMGLSEADWLETVEWMREEALDDVPGLEVPVDRQGAEYFATINSKLPMYYPADLQDIFSIFHAAGVSWTIPGSWWEGTNYAMFTGDLEIWEQTLRQQAQRVQELGCKVLAYTECGHGYFATLAGYRRFGIQPPYEVVHVVSLYAQWLREGRLSVDPARNPGRITVHDPCNATRKATRAGFPSIERDLRYVLGRICQDPVLEMIPSGVANYCCSGGGGALLAGFRQARNHHGRAKVDQVDRTGAEQVCTPCVNCFDGLDNLARDHKRPWRPVHLWKLLARALVLD